MQVEKHTLSHDLPEHKHTIRHLKMNDRHFVKQFDEYHDVNKQIHHIEEQNEAVSDEYLESLKKQRVVLKDQLFAQITETEKAL
ncbi:YdcH family protein [Aliiglaciecola sp. 2_MG-2023]|uniref:YdcH family protein n=1 Tax=unclassified Aliiglaciecola TaxID=2593648 RepID=UPI0026E3FB17|nr:MULTISPECIES: YdcH family protein [unclassified Aliiglaciecola]MDO6711677.1 YdcH family protein [Aliiglaciecola sp. 2_MG-2023]MDO6752748.1 YdcH family protein [Aliiglaciecola sp. 1_MG-2023]